MKYKKYMALCLSTLSLLWACGSSNSSIEDYKSKENGAGSAGANIFDAKCSMCHSLNEDKIGPALSGVKQRWGNDEAKLKMFIRDAQSVIKGGDAYAATLYEKWNKSNMPSFTNLSDKEMNDLVEYLK
jgi:cytochrome c2